MHQLRWIVIVAGCFLLSSGFVLADEPDKLPPDGWWVRYFCKIKQVNPTRTDEYTAKVTFAFVGTEVIDGETYRWIEILTDDAYVHDVEGPMHHVVLKKYLFSSKDLLQGEALREKAKRGWSRVNEGAVNPLGDRNKPGDLHFYFVYAWKQSESFDQTKVIDYQHGQLTIPTARRIEKTEEVTRQVFKANIKSVQSTERIAWFDSKVGPACAAAQIVFTEKRDDNQVFTRTDDIAIEDSGLDAKSKLPDNN